jgi:hypothetical protein
LFYIKTSAHVPGCYMSFECRFFVYHALSFHFVSWGIKKIQHNIFTRLAADSRYRDTRLSSSPCVVRGFPGGTGGGDVWFPYPYYSL